MTCFKSSRVVILTAVNWPISITEDHKRFVGRLCGGLNLRDGNMTGSIHVSYCPWCVSCKGEHEEVFCVHSSSLHWCLVSLRVVPSHFVSPWLFAEEPFSGL